MIRYIVHSELWSDIWSLPNPFGARSRLSKEPYKKASKGTVAGWVKEAISGAYSHLSRKQREQIGIRAHDTRGVATTWAATVGVPFEDIMDAAAWSRPQTSGTAARKLFQILPQLMLNGGTLLPMGAGKDLLIKQEIRSNSSFMINTYLRALPSLLYPPLDLEFYSLKGGIRPICADRPCLQLLQVLPLVGHLRTSRNLILRLL